jgi:hypothetical protein
MATTYYLLEKKNQREGFLKLPEPVVETPRGRATAHVRKRGEEEISVKNDSFNASYIKSALKEGVKPLKVSQRE